MTSNAASAVTGAEFPAFESKYEALGIPLPDPDTMCHTCDGTGVLPVYQACGDRRGPGPRAFTAQTQTTDPLLVAAWNACEAASPSQDGWHFVRCPECAGCRLSPADSAACWY